jgi:hypothetical protein
MRLPFPTLLAIFSRFREGTGCAYKYHTSMKSQHVLQCDTQTCHSCELFKIKELNSTNTSAARNQHRYIPSHSLIPLSRPRGCISSLRKYFHPLSFLAFW